MNKKLLLFIFLLGSLFVQGQTEYAILIRSKINPRSVWPPGDNDGNHYISAGVNSCSIDFYGQNDNAYKYCFFYITGNPTELVFNEIMSASQICGSIRRTSVYNKDTFSGWFFSGCLANSQIMPIHITQPDTNLKCNEDPITLRNGWNWQYKLDNGQWTDFPPQFQEQGLITFKIKDLPNYTNQSIIRFQTGYQTQFTNIVTYNIIPCSPKLDNTSAPNLTTCSYSNGSVTFTFSRPLETAKGEKFLFNRVPVGNGNPSSATSNDPEVEKISALSYKWNNIPVGRYDFKYQTQFGNNTPSTPSTITTFEIKQNTALTFWATAIQPECSGDRGFIEINAAGGTSPYYYILDDETEVVNGQTVPKKIGFSNGHKIPITTDGGHKVIVVDNSDCIEK
ncbi:hypothetical protein [Flavobacterium sp. T12S277]|uniref:hypothetical protein n=1 Tax=Flavobacterium sp. T12S277 TaxID=3402752 RepID=UPI003AEA8D97